MTRINPYKQKLNDVKEELNEFYYTFGILDNFAQIPDFRTSNITEFKLSLTDLTMLIHDFFEICTPKKFYTAFLKSFLNTKIYILKEKNNNELADTYIKNNQFIINIYKQNNFDDIVSLTHECTHNIDCILNPERRKYYIELSVETSAIFMELLISKYYELNGFEKLSIENQARNFRMKLNDAKDIINLMSVIKEYNNKPIDDYDKITTAINNAQTDLIPYILNYIIAINLFKIYETNQNLAFYILEKAIMFDSITTNYMVFNMFLDYDLFNINNVIDYKETLIRKINRKEHTNEN